MKRFHKSWALAAILTATLASVLAPRAAAQNDGAVRGQILDIAGKPWVDLGIQVVSDQGVKTDTKTDKDGNYVVRNLRSGIYTEFIQLPAPNKPYEVKFQITGGAEAKVDLNFKEIAAKQGAEYQEAAKKVEEAKSKLEGLKAHFNAGNTLIDQEKQAKIELQKAPADQRAALKQKLTDLSDQAVTGDRRQARRARVLQQLGQCASTRGENRRSQGRVYEKRGTGPAECGNRVAQLWDQSVQRESPRRCDRTLAEGYGTGSKERTGLVPAGRLPLDEDDHEKGRG